MQSVLPEGQAAAPSDVVGGGGGYVRGSDRTRPEPGVSFDEFVPPRGAEPGQALAPAEIHSSLGMRRVLAKERDRADRGGPAFCLVVFDLKYVLPQLNGWLVRQLIARVRLADEIGWLEDRRLAVLLHNADAAGARSFAHEIQTRAAATAAGPLEVSFYPYPGNQPGPPSSLHRREKLVPSRSGEASRWPWEGDQSLSLAVAAGDPEVNRSAATFLLRPLPSWKRAIDIVGSTVTLLLAAPIIGLAAALVKATSPGPAFFKQPRAGLGGKPFNCYKIRSMVVDAEQQKEALRSMSEQDGPAFKIAADPRVTRIGRILRKTSIDELPQLWNVLKGEMSLVGPRPPTLDEVAKYQQWHRRRLDVTPGITCIWQVEGRSRVSFDEWMRMDARYIRLRGLATDLGLMVRTIPAVLLRRGAR